MLPEFHMWRSLDDSEQVYLEGEYGALISRSGHWKTMLVDLTKNYKTRNSKMVPRAMETGISL